MSDEHKPSEDLKEGLGLIFRAARSAAKRVDMSKIDKGLDKAISQASRAATHVGRAVADELNRMSANNPPPWQSKKKTDDESAQPSPPSEPEEGRVWASQDQQSEKSAEAKTGERTSDGGPTTGEEPGGASHSKVRVATEEQTPSGKGDEPVREA